MKIKKGDKVKVIAGKDKGKEGAVLKVLIEEMRVLVEGVNIVKKHVKATATNKEGGIVQIERPIHVSNVMVIDPKKNIPSRIGYKLTEGRKYRVAKRSQEAL